MLGGNRIGSQTGCLILSLNLENNFVGRSHNKSDRLKNSKSHFEVKSERHYLKQLLKESPVEELEDLESEEVIRPVKEEGLSGPFPIKKIVRKDKHKEI